MGISILLGQMRVMIHYVTLQYCTVVQCVIFCNYSSITEY